MSQQAISTSLATLSQFLQDDLVEPQTVYLRGGASDSGSDGGSEGSSDSGGDSGGESGDEADDEDEPDDKPNYEEDGYEYVDPADYS